MIAVVNGVSHRTARSDTREALRGAERKAPLLAEGARNGAPGADCGYLLPSMFRHRTVNDGDALHSLGGAGLADVVIVGVAYCETTAEYVYIRIAGPGEADRRGEAEWPSLTGDGRDGLTSNDAGEGDRSSHFGFEAAADVRADG